MEFCAKEGNKEVEAGCKGETCARWQSRAFSESRSRRREHVGFSRADFVRADFCWADFSWADLVWADLVWADC
jgi:uncharacterized protein YjbI with pentapeptide repeats